MFIDFNSFGNDDIQSSTRNDNQRFDAIIPKGSIVKVKVIIQDSQYGDADCKCITTARKSGLKGLQMTLEVIKGSYSGVRWFQNIWLPEQMQTIELTEGQKKACNLGGHTLREIIDAGKGLKRDDKSPNAVTARKIGSFYDLNGLQMWVGVSTSEYNGKTRQELSFVVPCDHKTIPELEQSGEKIVNQEQKDVAIKSAEPNQSTKIDFSTDQYPF